jgi:hemerythrin superfamily protein/sporulation protein YlmC with PRC-barrel domain
MYPRVLSAATIVADEVRDADGEPLGRIEELVIDIDHGRVAYAVLSISDRWIPLPWQALRLSEEHRFVADLDRGLIARAPGFDRRNWPDMSDPAFHQAIDRHYGMATAPGSARAQSRETAMASKGIFDLLIQDHRKVDDLIAHIEKSEDEEECNELFAELRTALLAHSQAEDEVFYSRLEEEDETESLIGEARNEHQQVEDLLEQLGEIEDEDAWMKRYADLKQAVQHHVHEEEHQLFPKARKVLDKEMADELGREFTEIEEEEMEGLQAAGDEIAEGDEPQPDVAHVGGRRPGLLDSITKKELVERAKAKGVQGYSHMTKAQLIEALRR